jgi:hypothetical protein
MISSSSSSHIQDFTGGTLSITQEVLDAWITGEEKKNYGKITRIFTFEKKR